MRTKIAVLLLLLFVCPLFAQDEKKPPGASQVTIPLETYNVLRSNNEGPAATVVDTILLSGGFRDRDFTIAFSGRTTGTRPSVRMLEQMTDVTISGCKGDAIVAHGGKGAFDLVPLAQTFNATCELWISGSDRLRMHVTSNVLAVRAAVDDAELLVGDEDDAGARDYTLVRHVSGPSETLAATATGRYLITLLPDATRFRYAIDVHNPNRTTSSLELTLQSNEHLQQIDSAAPYEVTNGRYVFSIPPGDSAITLTGELRGTSFVAPVKASLQYLVIESHPLLRPTIQTPAKRISLGETGVTPTYRGAVAFETGTERIAWQVTRLQALHAISYAVNVATHQIFVPIDGPVLGESTFGVHNEGAPELVLPSQPEPTYVSLGNEAMLMTKNAAGQVTVPLSQGDQEVLVQHRQQLRRGLGFAFGRVAVPQLSVPATQTTLNLTYPTQWVPLYESFGSRARIWTPEGGQIALFLILAIWIERLLAWLGAPMGRRFAIAFLTALAATIVMTFLVLTVIVFGALSVAWIIAQPLKMRIVYSIGTAGVVLFLLMFTAVTSHVGNRAVKYDTTSSDELARDQKVNAPQEQQNHPPESPAYQGLPAKFTLPDGARWSSFSQELLRVDRPQTAAIIAISFALTNWIGVLVALAGIVLLWRDRRALVETLRAKYVTPQSPSIAPDTAG